MIASTKSGHSGRDGFLRSARFLAIPVFILSFVAAAMGLFSTGEAGPGTMTNAWGSHVLLDGHGVYARESVSGAAQERGRTS